MGVSIIAVVLVFGIIVLVHELGHFLAAKWMGVRVERFSIGFPPRLFGKKIGDTDYCISAIPLGGYVKMAGMLDESMDTKTTGADYEFMSKPVWKRIVIIVAGVTMNVILAITILTILSYKQGEAIIPTTEIAAVGKGGIAQRIGFNVGDKILSVNDVAISTWNEYEEEVLDNLNSNITYTVDRHGQILDLYFKKEWFREEKSEIPDIEWMPLAKVGELSPGMPAAELGLQRGDEIVEIDGKEINNWQDMTEVIRQNPEDSIRLNWRRNGDSYSAYIVPKAVDVPETAGDTTGAMLTIGQIGIGPYVDYLPVSFGTACVNGVNRTIQLVELNMRAIWWVVSGTKPARDLLGGPITIATMASKAAAVGWAKLWTLIAALSAMLAFINILPIPALDGGHLVLLLIEGIKRKPLSIKTKMAVQQVGMAILFTLIILIFYVDIKRYWF
jgi:regulator of sigma E protease